MKQSLQGFWWVLAFAILTFALYEQASHKIVRAIVRLENRKKELEAAIQLTSLEQEELKLQVASQSDPQWIEFCLMKGLGVIPEGYTKVYFEQEVK
jgi:hypothetical protein